MNMPIEFTAAAIGAVAGALGTAVVQGVSKYLSNKKYIQASLQEIEAALIAVRDFDKYKSNGSIIPTHVNTLVGQLSGITSLSHELRSKIFYTKKYAKSQNYQQLSEIAGGCIRVIEELERGNWLHFKGRNRVAIKRYIKIIKDMQK